MEHFPNCFIISHVINTSISNLGFSFDSNLNQTTLDRSTASVQVSFPNIELKMKSLKETIFGYGDLMQFYRRIFSIFHWQCYLPPSIDLKVSKLSFALNRHVFLYSLLNLIGYAWCLHIYYCKAYQHLHRYQLLQMFSTLYVFPIWIAFSSIFLSFDNFKRIWFEFMCLDNLILKRLNHKNSYHKFQRSIVTKMIFCLAVLILCGILKSSAENKLFPFQEFTYVLKLTRLYIELHAIFVISLHQYMYQLFCKYINFAHHLRRSNLIFLCIEQIDTSLKYYKEIHYKFWSISCELNTIFGITLMTFCCQTSIEVTVAVCHVFSAWEQYYTNEYLKILSSVFHSIAVCVVPKKELLQSYWSI